MRAKTQSDPYREADRSTAGRLEVPGTKVMRLIMCLVLGTLSLGTYAQDAFYIYRNDGDFNGFFYDEVIEIRQSKIGVDSLEYEQWVTQEVVLEDTIYRIPLAAIDSIGFQQPEIKFNPKVRFMERDGYSKYFKYQHNGAIILSKDLPADMELKVGDVLIGLPSDSISKKYEYLNHSFSMVIESIVKDDSYFSDAIIYNGRPVSQIDDVFERFVAVEKIGYDQQGNVCRRMSGVKNSEFPYRVQKAEGSGELTFLDIDGEFNKDWEFTGNSKADVKADVKFKGICRVAYNIGWTHLLIKMTRDYQIRLKPSVGASISGDFHGVSSGLIELPAIMFPATCPIFEFRPYPDIFLRLDGSIEARLNLPQVYLGFGEDITFDNHKLFPVTYWMHWVPDETAQPTDDMLDLSAELTFNGSIHMGIEFQAILGTAKWFEGIMTADVGLHLNVGPKISANLKLNADLFKGETSGLYSVLSDANITATLMQIELSAGATAGVLWDDPEEVTFYGKSWGLLTSKLYFIPQMESPSISYQGDSLILRCKETERNVIGSLCHMSYGLYKTGGYMKDSSLLERYGDYLICAVQDPDTYYSYTLTPDEIIKYPCDQYILAPRITHPVFGELEASHDGYHTCFFIMPPVAQLEVDSMTFGGEDKLTQSVTFTTNCPQEGIVLSGDDWWVHAGTLEVVDAKKGVYKANFVADKNNWWFDRTGTGNISLHYGNEHGGARTEYKIKAYQTEGSLANVSVSTSGYFAVQSGGDKRYLDYEGAVTATRKGKDEVALEGSYVNDKSGSYYTTNVTSGTFKCRVKRITNEKGEKQVIFTNGVITYDLEEETYNGKIKRKINSVQNFADLEEYVYFESVTGRPTERRIRISGPLTSASYDYIYHNHNADDEVNYKDEEIHETFTQGNGGENYISIKYEIKTGE